MKSNFFQTATRPLLRSGARRGFEGQAVKWQQQWKDALFLHFPVAAEELRPHMPADVEIDTFAGQAWLSYVFFRLTLRPAGLPYIPGLSSLVELNVRTYVRRRKEPGICFLRMYADNRLAIWASRWLTPLCYEPAVMIDERLSDGTRRIECRPLDESAGVLAVNYSIAGVSAPARAESLDSWLLERYRLFVGNHGRSLLAAEVEHEPWRVSAVEACAVNDRMSGSLGFMVDEGAAIVHCSAGVEARFGGFHAFPIGQTREVGTAHTTRDRVALLRGGR